MKCSICNGTGQGIPAQGCHLACENCGGTGEVADTTVERGAKSEERNERPTPHAPRPTDVTPDTPHPADLLLTAIEQYQLMMAIFNQFRDMLKEMTNSLKLVAFLQRYSIAGQINAGQLHAGDVIHDFDYGEEAGEIVQMAEQLKQRQWLKDKRKPRVKAAAEVAEEAEGTTTAEIPRPKTSDQRPAVEEKKS